MFFGDFWGKLTYCCLCYDIPDNRKYKEKIINFNFKAYGFTFCTGDIQKRSTSNWTEIIILEDSIFGPWQKPDTNLHHAHEHHSSTYHCMGSTIAKQKNSSLGCCDPPIITNRLNISAISCWFDCIFACAHAFQGNVRFMKLLLSRHADWRLKDLEEMTPLHLATRHSSSKPLSLLLKHMAPGEVDTQDRNKVPNDTHRYRHYTCSLTHSAARI